jgi:hypothetical protein
MQDFEAYYEARLGVRHEPADDGDDGAPLRGSDHLAGRPAVPRANGGADLAVFEQFERMVLVRRLRYLAAPYALLRLLTMVLARRLGEFCNYLLPWF